MATHRGNSHPLHKGKDPARHVDHKVPELLTIGAVVPDILQVTAGLP